jgi:hypothetical protein
MVDFFTDASPKSCRKRIRYRISYVNEFNMGTLPGVNYTYT